jgi:hypothetical protein
VTTSNPTASQLPAEFPSAPPHFADLFTGPQTCQPASDSSEACSGCDCCLQVGRLTATEAEGLWAAAERVSATMHLRYDSGDLLNLLPGVCAGASQVWQRRFVAAVDAIQVYLSAGLTPVPRCTAEEYAVVEMLALLDALVDVGDVDHVDVDRLDALLVPTSHVTDLDELDDLDALDELDEVDAEEALASLVDHAASCCGTTRLLPSQWFLPHDVDEPWVPESLLEL